MKRIAQKLAAIAAGMTLAAAGAVQAQEKPSELKVGITTFTSGSASVFGVPGKAAAEILIDKINAEGGIGGVKVVPTWIDEGIGGDRLLSEYRRVVQEQGVEVMLSAISSGNCLIVAPVAEDLKVLNLAWDCGTEKLLEETPRKYVVRPAGNATTEMMATLVYLLKNKPDFKTVAIVNQDYSWGRDSRDILVDALKVLKPEAKVVAEMFPKFGASDFSTEISRLQALRPDVIISTSWGGDLDTFLRQSAQRGLFQRSTFVLPLAESSIERLGSVLPEGVIVGGRGDHYFLHPETRNDPEHQAFIKAFRDKTGAYPIYPTYHMAQSLTALKQGYENAIKANGGKWPTVEQVAEQIRSLTFQAFGRPIQMREDGQGLEAQLLGTTRKVEGYPFPVMDNMMIVPAEIVTPPVGEKSHDWIGKVKPDLLNHPDIKTFSYQP
jgi:branched-chain amino acid transport system substrate-binding protein